MLFRERSVNVGFFKKDFVFFLNSIYKYIKNKTKQNTHTHTHTHKKKRDSNQRQEGKTLPKSAPYTARLCNQFYWPIYILIMISRWSAHRASTVGLLLLQRFRVGLLLSTRLVSSQWWFLIYMFAVSIYWWVEVFHADRTISICIWTTAEPRMRLLQRKPV